MRNSIFLVLTIFLFGCFSCSKSKKTEKAYVDSVLFTYTIFEDSITHAWNVMIKDDNEKFDFLKRLLLEVSYTNNFNQNAFDSLSTQVEEVRDSRYDRNTMASSDLIDQFDSATAEISYRVTSFASSHPQYEEFPLMGELISDISNKNGMVLFFRIHHDAFVKDRNLLVDENYDILVDNLNKEVIKRRPTFEISE